MKQLILDTSLEKALIAIAENGKCLSQINLEGIQLGSKLILPSIDDLLKEKGWTVKDLELITAGIGPGSYTGMRSSASFSQSLSLTLDIPLNSFCSLEAYLPKEPSSFAVIVDAKYGGAYLLKGILEENGSLYFEKPMICSLENLDKELISCRRIVSPGVNPNGKFKTELPWDVVTPSGESIAQRYSKGPFNQGTLELIYLK